ncbi:cyclin-T1 isoform X2 [Scleropages formosus]|nr:cyclin-T1-like isoform X2 [Scleropages formosus]
MHRFYMIQSFTRFHRNVIAPATLFLAAKVEEQPRKLEHVIKVAHACLNPQDPSPDTRSDAYLQQAQDLVILESIILQTLAFEITIDHPHTHVVKCTQLVRASKDLAQTSYFMATNSLHLTTFCLQYSPPIVACVCIHLACKWSNWEIPVSTDGKHWWEYVDPTVTLELLDELTHEFLQILEKTPSRLKRIRNWKAAGQTAKKAKVQEEGDQTEAMMSMISMASSESTLAGLMSLSAPSATSSSSLAAPSLEEKERGAVTGSQNWQSSGKAHGGSEMGAVPQTLHVPAKVSLSEYRTKNADVLAAQKRKLENMEASLKRDYASAAQALIGQQRKEKYQQQSSSHNPAATTSEINSPSHIILKIPLEKERQDRNSLKMRLPLAGGGGHGTGHGTGHSTGHGGGHGTGHSGGHGGGHGTGHGGPGHGSSGLVHGGGAGHGGGGVGASGGGGAGNRTIDDFKVRIRVPDRRSGQAEEGKSREKHRERSNHHHHHHHHHHSSASGGSSSSSSSSSHKHSGSGSGLVGTSKKSGDSSRTSLSSSSSSRKRPHSLEPSLASHPSKPSKSSRTSYQLPLLPAPGGHSLGLGSDGLHSVALPHHQGAYSHSKADKADTNGHSTGGGSQSNEYQDTFDMLNSLLSAQGVQPSQPVFDYRSQYGEYRYPSGQRGSSSRPPPLPAEPPPPLPPLPK